MQINTSLTPQQHLLTMINEANPARSLDLTQILFGPPRQTGREPAGHNTTVTVTAIKGSGYAGSQDVSYQRIGLGEIVAASGSIVSIPDQATSTADTIGAVTAHFDLIADQFSLNAVQSTRPTDGTLQATATLTANTTSYIYTGPDVAIGLQWNAPQASRV